MRILVSVVVLGAAEVWRAPLLIEQTLLAEVLRVAVIGSAALSALGLFTRAATMAMAASLAVLFGIIQEQGTPIHVHHVVWLAVLMAASPAGAVWSIDSRRRGTPGLDDAAAAEATLRWACVVLALVYFFPGLHKLVDHGSPFTDGTGGESLARLVRLKAIEAGAAVPFAVDRIPALLGVGGALVIIGELIVVVAALLRPRAGLVVVAVIHLAIVVVMHMPYTVLAVFGLVFALPASHGLPFATFRRAPVVSALASLMVIGIAWAGVRGDLKGYPFACYPTFSVPVPQRIRVLDVSTYNDVGALAAMPHGVVVPDDLRTPVTFALRRVTTAAAAERFVAWRRKDPRFEAALSGARRVRVTIGVRDLSFVRAADATVLVVDVEL